MIRFGICDDDPKICFEVGKLIHDYMQSEKHDYKTYIFSNGLQLLDHGERMDILFLDIDMPELDGFQTAYQLNLTTDETVILFLTSYTKDFQKAFRVHAFRYLIKPVRIPEFNEAVRDSLNELLSFRKIIIGDSGREVLVAESKIVYIESIGDKTAVHTVSHGALVSGRTLKDWETELDCVRFVRSHRAYIINFDYVKKLEGGAATLVTGATVPVSARSVKTVKDSMREYIRKRAR